MATSPQLSQLIRNIGNGNAQDMRAIRTEVAALLKQNPDLNPVPLIKNAVKEALQEYDSDHPQRVAIVGVSVPSHKHKARSTSDGGTWLWPVRPFGFS